MSSWLRLTLITMTVGGGFTGIALSLQMLSSQQIAGAEIYAIYIGFLILSLFVLVSGLVFVQNPDRFTLLAFALAIQIPQVTSQILAFRFGLGIHGGFGLSTTGPFGWVRVGGDVNFGVLRPLPWSIGVNLVALILLAALTLSVRRQRRHQLPAASLLAAAGSKN